VTPEHAALLLGGGLFAGVFNTLAGGGSILSVPLLVLVGLPGTLANGTNRLGILAQSLSAAWRFRAKGVSGFRGSLPILLPVVLGSSAGALLISSVSDRTFERLFGVLMILLLVPILWRRPEVPSGTECRAWSPLVSFLVFLAIGLYGGAFQAGVGLVLVVALSHTGYGLVHANSIKAVVNAALALIAFAVFVLRAQVVWLPGAVLAIGYALGGEIGARLAVYGGERLIRPVLSTAVLLLAGRMLGVY
jgi:uncharacterized membrane protein YfcA